MHPDGSRHSSSASYRFVEVSRQESYLRLIDCCRIGYWESELSFRLVDTKCLEGTDHWDKLLMKRAEISGERVLSDFTRKTLDKLKKD